jgi:hypothetical protein
MIFVPNAPQAAVSYIGNGQNGSRLEIQHYDPNAFPNFPTNIVYHVLN